MRSVFGPRRLSQRRPGVLAAAVLLAAGGLFAPGAGVASAAGSAPVRACPAETTGPGLPALGAVPATAAVPDGVDVPATAAVYGARYPGEVHFLVAPGGWTCDVAFFAADGGEEAFVHPGAAVADPTGARFDAVVQAVFVSGGAQTNIDLVCGFVPRAGAAPNTCNAPARLPADRVHSVPTSAPGLLLTAVGVPANTREPNLPATGGPNRTVALVTFQSPGGPAQAISCTLPASASPVPTCQGALGHFLATGAAAKQLTRADLAAALTDLDAFVASYLAQS
ncbi:MULTISPECIES: hypothetical protein [Kitasatospora]|uniref:Uncharacterized protein n=1 Tax=Kitasatospora cathayae TaxID=3004092 RepID=A0ABY7QE80_9ACTN|nr:hypothetical protein [Kitasatospora sp. HUAS 3-15]WBP91052.1 hypothetical protein O1G21_37745 [Kitasatospora sp. HUAS 3-15]